MIHRNYISKIFLSLILILSYSFPVFASEYACSIMSVLTQNEVGQYVSDAMTNNYMNRKIFIERETGKVIGTTALKARFKNFDKTHSPIVLHNAKDQSSYKAVTMYEDKGQFSSIRINENVESNEKPYSYQTAAGMLLAGTCVEKASEK